MLLFSFTTRPPPRSPLFPYTTLFRSRGGVAHLVHRDGDEEGRGQQDDPDDEVEEWVQSIGILRSRFVVRLAVRARRARRSEEHTSELQSRRDLVCRLLLEKKNKEETG